MEKKFFLFLISFLFAANAFSASTKFYSVRHSNEGEQIVYKENSEKKASSDGIEISVSAAFENEENSIAYVVKIYNKSDKDFYFNESDISIFEGNYKSEKWENLKYLPASRYYAKKQYESDVNDSLTALDFSLAVINALTPEPPPPEPKKQKIRSPKKDINEDDNKKPVQPKKRRPKPYHDDYFWHDMTYLEIENSLTWDSMLDFLKENLLFSKKVKSGEHYTGLVFSPIGVKPDYKFAVKVSENESLEYTFCRSDRDEILHPWNDREHGRHSVTFSITLPYERWGIYYIYSGTVIGAYAGMNFPFNGIDSKSYGVAIKNDSSLSSIAFASDVDKTCDYLVTATGKTSYEMSGVCAGLTIKMLPYTWLMLGCGLDIRQDFYEGEIYWRDKGDTSSDYEFWTEGWFSAEHAICFASPQIGINMIFNFVDITGIFEWRINEGPKFELMFGFAI